MDYNDNQESTGLISNQALNRGQVVIGTRDVITANDVINNRPLEFNATRTMDQFFNCDNKQASIVSENNENTVEGVTTATVLSFNRTSQQEENSLEAAKHGRTSWQELSPKKEKKCFSGDSSGSGSGSFSTASSSSRSSPSKSWKGSLEKGANKNQVITWRDVSPTKVERGISGSTSPQSPLRSPERPMSRQQSHRQPCSPEHGCVRHRGSVQGNYNYNEVYKIHSSPEHGPEGFPPPSPSLGNHVDDQLNNDYFYDEDFTVQFDTNLRESSPGLNCTCVDPSLMIGFPHTVTGSYLNFDNTKGTHYLNQNSTELFCPDESELSYSRNSAMDVSTSEREMMCSSDMLDFSDNPLFTPSPTHDVHSATTNTLTNENVMTDSLDKVTKDNLRLGHNMDLSSSQTSSSDINFCVNCCPRKDEYFLSFVGSQGSKGSASDNENSVTSVDSGQGHWTHQQNHHGSACSTEDGGEECSDSFHFSYSSNGSKLKTGNKTQRFNSLGAVQETSMEHSISSEDSMTFNPSSKTRRDLRLNCSAHAHTFPRNHCGSVPSKLSLTTSPKRKGHYFMINNGNTSAKSNANSRNRSKKVTSWRQVKSLRKLGRLENVLDPSRSSSMPDLQQNWHSLSSHDLQKLAESFHSKRHSAYLLDLYQRVKNQSNPVSPETMANIEHILFQPNLMNHGHIPHGDNGSLQKVQTDIGRDDSYSDHTLTNSHAHFTSSSQHPMEYSTRKRILEWLEKEKFEGTNRAKGSQTEVARSTKETIVSPTTVTLWCGTRNFSSQFPPSMKDCAIQTSVEEVPRKEKVCCHDIAQQTSPMSDRSQLLSLLPEKFNELEEIFPNEEIAEKNDKKSKLVLPRSKSADSARTKKMVSIDSSSKSTFYSHKSLPDLSFLKATPLTPDLDNFSLFDPLPSNTPLPVCVQTEDYAITQETIRNKVASHSHYARKEAEPHSGANYKRSRSAPPRTVNPNIPKTCAESGSSSSGFSTSSTSSGIDPGYSEPRSYHSGSPSNDIERLLFYPPHVESTAKKCDVCKSEPSVPGITDITPIAAHQQQSMPLNIHQQLVVANVQEKVPLVRHSPDKRINKYTNEVHPGVIDVRHRARTPPIKCPSNSSGLGSNGNSINSSQTFLEHLYALQEENTPVSSPERSASPYGFHYDINGVPCYRGDSCTCCLATIDLDAESLQEWHRDQLILRRRLDCQIQISSESGSSSSSSLIPNNDKKPLKSCLRKKQVIRSRSMSEPYGLLQQIEGQRRQQATKVNRHSYACEEVYLLRDETGEYYLCENKDETEEEEMEEEEVDEDEKDEDKDREVGMFYLEDDSNTQTVRRRQKKDKKPAVTEEKKENADDSSDKELSGKRKSVSFASEVSFHAISPQDSPKRRDKQPDDDEEEEEEKKEETPVTVENKPKPEDQSPGNKSDSLPKPVNTQSSVTSIGSCDSDSAPPAEFLLSPPTEMPGVFPSGPEIARRRVLLQQIGCAAEALVRHFAKAKNPFDKLRLGSSADTPEVGELVLSTLCPAINKVVGDGLKTYLTGVQVFGRVQVTIWKLTEATAEQGPYTRAIYDLVQQLKTHSRLATHNHKFEAFILGLLNLRLLDYWVGYIRHSDFITEKYYNQDAVVVLGKTIHQREFDEMLTALQELAILPFQLNFDLVVEKFSKSKSSPNHSPTHVSPLGSPTSNKGLPKDDKGSPPAKPPRKTSSGITTGLTTTAWNWFTGGGTTEPTEQAVESNHGNSMISSLTSMLGNWRGKDNKGDTATKEATPTCQSNNQQTETEKSVDKITPKHLLTSAEVEAKKINEKAEDKVIDDTESTTNNKTSQKYSPVKNPDNAAIIQSASKSPVVKDQETSPSHKERKEVPEASEIEEKSMIESVTGITQKLLGIAPTNKEKSAYKKGVTDYDFNTEKLEEKAKKERSPESSISRIPVPSRPTHQRTDTSNKEKSPENSVVEKQGSKQESDAKSTTSSCSSSQEERPQNLKLKRPATNAGKNKSGLIKLFDKLLLPKDSATGNQKGQSQKPKNRWSWGASHNTSGASENTKTGTGARPKSVCIPKQESPAPPRHVCHSAIPAPTKKKSTATSAKENKEISKNVKASPANSTDLQKRHGGQENDQVKVKMSQSGDPKGDNSKPSILNKDDPKRDQSLLVQLDKSGEAKLQQTFHVDDKGEANLRQRVELDKTGQSRDQKLTVQLDKSTQVKLQQTVELNQTGEAKLQQTVEVDEENKKDSSKPEMKPIRNSWKAVERGPTLILPTTCKFLDNIEERKKNNDPESPKRRKNESPKRSPSARPSPTNSPKSPRTKSTKRWSLYNPTSKKDELVDLDINSNSAEQTQQPKSAPTTPVKSKVSKIDQSSPSRKSTGKGDVTKNKKTEKKLDNAAKKKDTAEKEEEKMDFGAEKKKDPECFFYKPKFRYIKTVKKFESSDPGYLSFEEGEYFEVLAQVDALRLFCVNGKKEGLIQIEAVKSMTDREEFDTLHDNFYQ